MKKSPTHWRSERVTRYGLPDSEVAQADLNEGFLFYEAQEPGLGDPMLAVGLTSRD